MGRLAHILIPGALILAALPHYGIGVATAQTEAAQGGIVVTKGDITDRPYRVLGDISVTVKKAAIIDNPPIEEKVTNALRAKAAAMHADAVIMVRTESSGFDILSFGHVDGHGRAIAFLKPGETRPAISSAQPAGNAAAVVVGAPTEAQMKATLHTYVDTLNAGDAKTVAGLYADDATIEDPAGAPVKQGRQQIDIFFRDSVAHHLQYELVAPIRGSNINAAAMTIKGHVGPMTINATEIFTFNPDGKIASMKAYWGKSDVEAGGH